MKSFEGSVEAFVVSCESAEACCPGEATFDDPAARQEHETSFGHGVFDHFEADAVAGGGRNGFAGVALIDIRQLDRIASNLLHLLGQRFDLGTIAGIGRGHGQGH